MDNLFQSFERRFKTFWFFVGSFIDNLATIIQEAPS